MDLHILLSPAPLLLPTVVSLVMLLLLSALEMGGADNPMPSVVWFSYISRFLYPLFGDSLTIDVALPPCYRSYLRTWNVRALIQPSSSLLLEFLLLL